MILFLFLSCLVASSIGLNASNETHFPLCTFCKCQTGTTAGAESADVECFEKVHHDIFSLNFWVNTTANKTITYNYRTFSIQNNVLTHLHKDFPSSNLIYLNLANNDISSINQSVFRNLQNMEILILSHNNLDDIDPDAFRVSRVFLILCHEFSLNCKLNYVNQKQTLNNHKNT